MKTSVGRLDGIGVLVTRPAGRGAVLAARIEQHGGRAIPFPVIEIAPPAKSDALLECLNKLPAVDLVIFVSVHAVHNVAALLKMHRLQIPAGTRVAAVGPETAAQCEGASIKVDFVPRERIDSEGLLEALGGFEVAGKTVLIFRGQSGREVIKRGLEARGADVRYVESYRRKVADLPPTQVKSLLARWRKNEIHLVVATSVSVVDALTKLIGPRNRELLETTPVFTYSRRVADYCREIGFTEIRVAEKPDDAAMVDAIVKWAAA